MIAANVAFKFYPPDVSLRPHAHDVAQITLVFGGALRESVGRDDETARALSVAVKPAGVRHANLFGGEITRTLQVTLAPDEWPIGRWRWLHGNASVVRALLRLALRKDEVELADVVAALAEPQPAAGAPPRWLRLTREALDDCRDRPSDLAAIGGVHPVHLAREFRRWYGTSIADYLHMKRVRTAAQLVSRGSRLAEAAHESGFADHAHMCRVFRRMTGVTPGAFAAMATADVAIVQDERLHRT